MNTPKRTFSLPTITPRAAKAITKLLARVPDKFRDQQVLPVITWLTEGTRKDFVPGPEIGLNYRRDVPARYIVQVHGIEVAIGLPEALLEQYSGYELDYLGKRFIFVQPKML